MAEEKQEISLRVPGEMAYALVIRTALGGVAILKDLNVDQMDDLRAAADEACDCLLHQGRAVSAVQVRVQASVRAAPPRASVQVPWLRLP